MPNFIASQNINGNISSCKTEISIVNCSSRSSLFYCNDIGFATNNCTGETQVLNSWSLSGFSIGLMVLVTTISVIGFIAFLARD